MLIRGIECLPKLGGHVVERARASVIGLDYLPELLSEVAQVRLEMPDATLKELGENLSHPVGKSGVNHRLRKISAVAESLREERGE